MKIKHYARSIFFVSATLIATTLQIGCGEDPSLYQGETLAFENTPSISAKDVVNNPDELDLGADESSDFWLNYYYPWAAPYAPYPIFDYYLSPLAIDVPISPVASIVDYVHPFYAYRHINPFWGFDDDDDGHRRHHDNDDDF
ncbi:MAG: hypothetical protein KC505_00085 [Myxococcales bacterium]|nr:hypothetical protein [Myxococcales bacterium]USN50484.1 MAG: hypothetical protein H6731_09510 [Myxococcales bacterium]